MKTLHNAIEYIRRLQMLLQEIDYYEMVVSKYDLLDMKKILSILVSAELRLFLQY